MVFPWFCCRFSPSLQLPRLKRPSHWPAAAPALRPPRSRPGNSGAAPPGERGRGEGVLRIVLCFFPDGFLMCLFSGWFLLLFFGVQSFFCSLLVFFGCMFQWSLGVVNVDSLVWV